MDINPPPDSRASNELQIEDYRLPRINSCVETRERIVKALRGNFKSEVASYSDEFGYIFRYRIESDGISSSLVLWSRDCEKFMIATYPYFSLDKIIQSEH